MRRETHHPIRLSLSPLLPLFVTSIPLPVPPRSLRSLRLIPLRARIMQEINHQKTKDDDRL